MTNQVTESITQFGFPADLVDTPYILQVVKQSIHYIQSGSFIHLQGPSDSGKTTFARYVACLLQQPVVTINNRLDHPDVLENIWQAAAQGHTLIFEEFQRTNTQDWQMLLPILEENLLNFPLLTPSGKYAHLVHPGFSVILTSNPQEQAKDKIALHLLDNYAIKITLPAFDVESEQAIIQAKSGIDVPTAQTLTQVLRELRAESDYEGSASIKLGILLGRILQVHQISVQNQPDQFQKHCKQMLMLPHDLHSSFMVTQVIQKALAQLEKETPLLTDIHPGPHPEDEEEEEQQPLADDKPDVPVSQVEPHSGSEEPKPEEITLMLHSEIELEMHFFDQVISFIQEISDEEAEVSFHHSGDAVQPDIMIKILKGLLPQVVAFIEQQINNEVLLIQKHITDFYECDILIKIPAQVASVTSPDNNESTQREPTVTEGNSVAHNSKQTTQVKAPSGDEMRIQKLKKLIANYEKFHSQS